MESDRTAISDDDVTVIWMGKKASPSEKTDDSRGSVQPSVPEQPLCLTSPLNNADDENTPLLPLAHESSLVLEESTRRQRASRLSVWLWFSLSVLGWIAVLGTVIGYIIFWWVTGSQV